MPFKSSKSKSDPNLLNLSKTSQLGHNLASAPIAPLQATGGSTQLYFDSEGTGYQSHTFFTSGSFSVTRASVGDKNNLEVFVVAGGGGGGGDYYSGGGGAGGVRSNIIGLNAPSIQNVDSIEAQTLTYVITVGAGGNGGSIPAVSSTVGSASSIRNSSGLDIIAVGGGGGGGGGASNFGTNGGSGGGGAYSIYSGGDATNYPGPNQQGHPGGTGSPLGGAGGGGAAGIGTVYDGYYLNNAGIGTFITASAGISSAFAAGGSGGGVSGPGAMTPRQSGVGGKGQTIHYSPGTVTTAELDALSNTGSGGGGCDQRNTGYTRAGNGSSGIVIIRYKV